MRPGIEYKNITNGTAAGMTPITLRHNYNEILPHHVSHTNTTTAQISTYS